VKKVVVAFRIAGFPKRYYQPDSLVEESSPESLEHGGIYVCAGGLTF